jgi:hypothetical protein
VANNQPVSDVWFVHQLNNKKRSGTFMLMNPLFVDTALHNRLGQEVRLGVFHSHYQGRDYVFVIAPTQQASSFVGKNAEPFAFQLREKFALDARRFELIEVRDTGEATHLCRWRFEWVGNSPLSARSEDINSPSLRATLLQLIDPAQIVAEIA